MTAEARGEDRHWSRHLYFSVPAPFIYAYLIGASLLYSAVYVHTPLGVYSTAPHDDSLYMTLGQYLADGRWLGPYDQFTLMKGPGYAFFLAFINWLRIPVSLAHAVFHCIAVTVLVVTCHRFIRSYLISGIFFALLLWHPILLSAVLLRVIRDAIYPAQIMLFLATFIWAQFCATGSKQRLWSGLASGLLLGWLWLTREEGAWLLPPITVLVAAAALQAFGKRPLRELASTVLMALVAFVATQAIFSTINRVKYKTFTGVDFKEKNFQRSLAALHSVVSGGPRPFVSVTRAARQKIYPVSPSFASLTAYFDVPDDQGWAPVGCASNPRTCGEIGSGWFMWALRDAAALKGHYASPAKASAFFGQLAGEIEEACAHGTLECEPQLIAEMPHVTWSQFADMPRSFIEALDFLLLLRPPLQTGASDANQIRLAAALKFLNHPLHTPSASVAQAAERYTISGWYNTPSGGDWIFVTLKDASGTAVDATFERRSSPDLAATNPKSTTQRYTLSTRCSDQCVLHLETPGGAKVEKKLADFRGRNFFADPVADGTFFVETVEAAASTMSAPRLPDKFTSAVRRFVARYYAFVFMPMLVVGIIAFLISTVLYWKRAAWNVCYVLALVSWMLVVERISLLVLITVTSMNALHGVYHGPACYLLVCATFLSIAAWLQLSGRSPPQKPDGRAVQGNLERADTNLGPLVGPRFEQSFRRRAVPPRACTQPDLCPGSATRRRTRSARARRDWEWGISRNSRYCNGLP